MLFAKNKPTKTLTFGDNNESHVVLQHLPKGVKDSYTSRLAELSFSMKGVTKETLEKMDLSALPDSMAGVVSKINELDYYKLANAIKSWSAEDPINEDTVKELDDTVFVEISNAIDEMNRLTETERKN
jgi:hypothetical protein